MFQVIRISNIVVQRMIDVGLIKGEMSSRRAEAYGHQLCTILGIVMAL